MIVGSTTLEEGETGFSLDLPEHDEHKTKNIRAKKRDINFIISLETSTKKVKQR